MAQTAHPWPSLVRQAEGSACGIALMQEQGMKQVPDMRAAATHEMDAR